MNFTNSTSESSCKGEENGDDSTGSERPLKKARFAWQVKGKYHLKNDANEAPKVPKVSSADDEAAGSSSCGRSETGTEQNLEILGDYLLKQDFNTLDSVITDSDKSLLAPSTSISNEKLWYPRYVSSSDVSKANRTSGNSDELKSFSTSMVLSQNYSEDQCIARWQARQMAKGFVDNTINRVLDSWIQVPIPTEEDGSRFLALDVADFINNLPGDNSVENEGILMAISAHGLQNTSNSSSNHSRLEESNSENLDCQTTPTRSLSPVSEVESNDARTNNHNYTDTSSNDLDLPWSYSEEQSNINDTAPFPFFPNSSSPTYQYYNDNNQNSNTDCDIEDNAASHCDFLDAAVMFAIQSKGLTAFGSEYG